MVAVYGLKEAIIFTCCEAPPITVTNDVLQAGVIAQLLSIIQIPAKLPALNVVPAPAVGVP